MAFKVLEEIIDNIEPIKINDSYFKIRFGYGSKADLINFLELAESEIANKNSITEVVGGVDVIFGKYPLIWLITPFSTKDTHSYYNIETKPTFMIANINEQHFMGNRERADRNLKLVLKPVFDSFRRSLIRSAKVKVPNRNFEPTTHFNYVVTNKTNKSGDKNSGNEVWDALEVSTDLKINNKLNCNRIQCS